jgi:hypothetical protein
MDPDGPKTRGSGSCFGSGTLIQIIQYIYYFKPSKENFQHLIRYTVFFIRISEFRHPIESESGSETLVDMNGVT